MRRGMKSRDVEGQSEARLRKMRKMVVEDKSAA